ncbi:hypothetical protein PoB_006848300 [Plakobranchus ocellatus]|uniref:Uncharacterized protein n=1 Tax=Plakobranchus ocellatus TaxID=259542 RepID=A0AAV4DD48_9GAST|nr:hypothetical protein PoB_006848300 [Plakobranchus ocellatus]
MYSLSLDLDLPKEKSHQARVLETWQGISMLISGHGGMAGKILCLSPSLNIFTKRKALQQNLKHWRIKRLP